MRKSGALMPFPHLFSPLLYFALQRKVPEVIRVGDAVAVRPADRAIFDGRMDGWRLWMEASSARR